jgi:hypothetical protein
VFLRSSLCDCVGTGGTGAVSFVTEFRESHENGLVRLLLGAVGVGVGVGPGEVCCGGAGGGAPHGTAGRTPERP